MPRKHLTFEHSYPVELEDDDLDIIDKVDKTLKIQQTNGIVPILEECRGEILSLREDIKKFMREQTWMKAEIERLHALLKEARNVKPY